MATGLLTRMTACRPYLRQVGVVGLGVLAIAVVQWVENRDAPGLANVHGYSHLSDGRPDEAIAQFNEVIRVKPDWYQPYVGRGTAYARKGDTEHALSDLDRSIELNPRYADAYL